MGLCPYLGCKILEGISFCLYILSIIILLFLLYLLLVPYKLTFNEESFLFNFPISNNQYHYYYTMVFFVTLIYELIITNYSSESFGSSEILSPIFSIFTGVPFTYGFFPFTIRNTIVAIKSRIILTITAMNQLSGVFLFKTTAW